MNLKKIQSALTKLDLDGWLFYDFHNRDHIAYRVLGLDFNKPCSRRWFCFVPRAGKPIKLVHAIEPRVLDSVSGKKIVYRGNVELHGGLREMLSGAGKVAMQYSPNASVPTNSLVDAGTVELVRALGVEVVSSAELVARIYSTLDAHGFALHAQAGNKVQGIKDEAFALIFNAIRKGKKLDEFSLQQHILKRFAQENLTSGLSAPIVAANDHAADPHFEPTSENSRVFKKNDRILLDIWAKVNAPGAIYYDITWCGYAGANPPAAYVKQFDLAMRARDEAIDFVRKALAEGKTVRGWEVDKACRDVIAAEGLEQYFLHRTGHSIDTSVHGDGANIDSLETQDDRAILPNTCFSIEPGIYKNGIGVRTEVSVCVDGKKRVTIFGDVQRELVTMQTQKSNS
ncbi:MAG TPA: M24 family metallopeptidase [Planctomycetota bacterium]|nr:M24 family metallopeptidase [Planctomycetota bacterium]